MKSNIKNIIIFIIILILVIVAYFVFFQQKNKDIPPLSSTSNNIGLINSSKSDQVIKKEFLATLLNLKNIEFDNSMFSSVAFLGLQDFTIILVQQEKEGRPNPFAPLGVDTEPLQSVNNSVSDSEDDEDLQP